MSGGSYNYLCYADASQITDKQGDLQDMADRLAELGYATDAASETQKLLLQIRAYENRITSSLERLYGVWRAVEWWDSGDSGEDDLKAALEKYRDA